MIVIGITGSIGTGKSTVTKQFAQCGVATLNSDSVVHSLLARGGAAVEPVARLFPETCDGWCIDRRLLGAEVFADAGKRKCLEAIIHPLVREAEADFIRTARLKGMRIVVLDIPLLFETHAEKRCDFTVVTTAPPFLQRLRVMARPQMTQAKFAHILAAQMPDAAKRKRGDFIVRTGLGRAASLKQVRRILMAMEKKFDCRPPRTALE